MGEDGMRGPDSALGCLDPVLGGVNLFHRARHPDCLVNVVNHLIQDDAARRRIISKPRRRWEWSSATKTQDRNLSHTSGVDRGFGLDILREVAHDMSREQSATSFPGERH